MFVAGIEFKHPILVECKYLLCKKCKYLDTNYLFIIAFEQNATPDRTNIFVIHPNMPMYAAVTPRVGKNTGE